MAEQPQEGAQAAEAGETTAVDALIDSWDLDNEYRDLYRKGIAGMAGVAQMVLEQEPLNGAFFVFRNRGGHMLRILCYDGSGFWLCTKRLSNGRFRNWPSGDGNRPCSTLRTRALRWNRRATPCAGPGPRASAKSYAALSWATSTIPHKPPDRP